MIRITHIDLGVNQKATWNFSSSLLNLSRIITRKFLLNKNNSTVGTAETTDNRRSRKLNLFKKKIERGDVAVYGITGIHGLRYTATAVYTGYR